MGLLWRHRRIAFQCGRGILLGTVLVSIFLTSCAKNNGSGNKQLDTLFPLSKGNAWVALRSGSAPDSSFDSMWINMDSVRTGSGGQEHWYVLRWTGFDGGRIWVRRDSVGDLWYTNRNFDSVSPFLLPSKIHGETWPFRRLCLEPDTLVLSDTTAAFWIPSGDLLQHVWTFSATASCAKGNWGIILARGYGPVSWHNSSSQWDLIQWRISDDASTAASSAPAHVLNPN